MPGQSDADARAQGQCEMLATCLLVSGVFANPVFWGWFFVAAAAAFTGAAVVGLCIVHVAELTDEASIDAQLKRMKMEFVESCGKSNRLKQIYQELKQMDFQKNLATLRLWWQDLPFCAFMVLYCLTIFSLYCLLTKPRIVVYTWIAIFSLVALNAGFIGPRQRELAQQELAEKKRLHALVFYQAGQRGTPFRTVARPPEPAIARALRRCLPKEEKMCRLCWGDEADGPLVKPCACRGSQMWVHEHCLEERRRTGVRQDAAYRCNLCIKEYRDALSLELLQKRTAPGQANGW